MVRNEAPRGRGGRRSFEDSYPKRGRGGSGRDSGRSSGRGRGDFEMTKVICSSCGVQCEVPFKPTSDKPLFCDKCFAKNGKSSSDRGSGRSSGRSSDRDLDVINEKLNKIMKALDIE